MNTKGTSKRQTKNKKILKQATQEIDKQEELKNKPLTAKEEAFVRYFIESNNQTQAAIKAGYSEKSARELANRLLKKVNVLYHIEQIKQEMRKDSIATGQEVMEYFSAVMRGEVKDQFGLEASLSERTRAAMELARRTTDIEMREKGVADSKVEINLNWKRD